MIGLIIAAALAGGLIVFLSILAIYYGTQVREARRHRDEAESISLQILEDKEKIEEEFKRIQQAYREFQNHPIYAQISDDQIKTIAEYVGANIMPFQADFNVKH